jgi:hypothetical protein
MLQGHLQEGTTFRWSRLQAQKTVAMKMRTKMAWRGTMDQLNRLRRRLQLKLAYLSRQVLTPAGALSKD